MNFTEYSGQRNYCFSKINNTKMYRHCVYNRKPKFNLNN